MAAGHRKGSDDRFRSQFKKTRLCVFFPEGRCTKGNSCEFAHGEEELQEAPDLSNTSLCQLWKEERCTLGSQCPYAHGWNQMKMTTAYKSPKGTKEIIVEDNSKQVTKMLKRIANGAKGHGSGGRQAGGVNGGSDDPQHIAAAAAAFALEAAMQAQQLPTAADMQAANFWWWQGVRDAPFVYSSLSQGIEFMPHYAGVEGEEAVWYPPHPEAATVADDTDVVPSQPPPLPQAAGTAAMRRPSKELDLLARELRRGPGQQEPTEGDAFLSALVSKALLRASAPEGGPSDHVAAQEVSKTLVEELDWGDGEEGEPRAGMEAARAATAASAGGAAGAGDGGPLAEKAVEEAAATGQPPPMLALASSGCVDERAAAMYFNEEELLDVDHPGAAAATAAAPLPPPPPPPPLPLAGKGSADPGRPRSRQPRLLDAGLVSGGKGGRPEDGPTDGADGGRTRTKNRKTRPCKYFMEGNCSLGDGCDFAHPAEGRGIAARPFARNRSLRAVPQPPAPTPPQALAAMQAGFASGDMLLAGYPAVCGWPPAAVAHAAAAAALGGAAQAAATFGGPCGMDASAANVVMSAAAVAAAAAAAATAGVSGPMPMGAAAAMGAAAGPGEEGRTDKVRHEMVREQCKKTKLCRYFEEDMCKLGNECPFAHGTAELANLPDLHKTSLCTLFKRGQCKKKSAECSFAHGKRELRVSKAANGTNPTPHAPSEALPTDAQQPPPLRERADGSGQPLEEGIKTPPGLVVEFLPVGGGTAAASAAPTRAPGAAPAAMAEASPHGAAAASAEVQYQ